MVRLNKSVSFAQLAPNSKSIEYFFQAEIQEWKQALTRCQKVKSRREREIWNPHLEFREEKREMLRSVFWFEKRTRTFAKKMEKF